MKHGNGTKFMGGGVREKTRGRVQELSEQGFPNTGNLGIENMIED